MSIPEEGEGRGMVMKLKLRNEQDGCDDDSQMDSSDTAVITGGSSQCSSNISRPSSLQAIAEVGKKRRRRDWYTSYHR